MVTKQQLSVEEYLALPEEPPYSEYVFGEVIQKMSPVPAHSFLIQAIGYRFGVYMLAAGGAAGPELRVEFHTERGPEYRLPDFSYFAPGRPMGGPRFGNPPTLAIEVRSPGESMEQQRAKCRYYLQYGVEVAWLIDPESRSAEVFDVGRDGERLGSDGALTSEALPGFELAPLNCSQRWINPKIAPPRPRAAAGGCMDFELTEEQQQVRIQASALAARFDDAYWRHCDKAHEFPWEFYQAFADAGWLGIAIPPEQGGAGLGITEASILLEEVAASGAAMNGATALHLTIFGLNPVVKHGSDELKSRILPQAAAGKLHVAFGVTEPNAGSDTPSITTFARRDGDRFIVNGQKVWTSKAQESSKVLLLARTTALADCAKRTDGMTLFLADLDPAHVTIREIDKLGRHAVDSNEVFYDDLPVDARDVVGEVGRGFYHLLDGLNPERILIAAEALGTGRAALRKATAYAKERVVFGRPIGQNQGIQFPLADSHAKLAAAELMIRKASWLYDQGKPCGAEANMAKYLAAEAGFEAADRALQTLGGFGYAREFDVERYWREVRVMRIAPVTQEMILNFLGQHELGLPRSY